MLKYRPAPAGTRLMVAPRLASWDGAASASRRHLQEFLDHATVVLAPSLKATPDPLALRLEVGLPPNVDVLHERDLDNYLHPLVTHLMKNSERRFASVTATKRHASFSSVGVTHAEPDDSTRPTASWRIRTTASVERAAYKEQIADGLVPASVLPPGPLNVDIVFGTGPGRSWVNLWKPTIDALGGFLGNSGSRPWYPEDGCITSLGLHHHLRDDLAHDVELLIHAQLLPLAT